MNKKEFDLLFHSTVLEVNSSFNSTEAIASRRYNYENIETLDNPESIRIFNQIENRQYAEELLYSILSKIIVDN